MELRKVEIARRVIIIAAIAIANTVAALLWRSALRNPLAVHIIFAPEHTHTQTQAHTASAYRRRSAFRSVFAVVIDTLRAVARYYGFVWLVQIRGNMKIHK